MELVVSEKEEGMTDAWDCEWGEGVQEGLFEGDWERLWLPILVENNQEGRKQRITSRMHHWLTCWLWCWLFRGLFGGLLGGNSTGLTCTLWYQQGVLQRRSSWWQQSIKKAKRGIKYTKSSKELTLLPVGCSVGWRVGCDVGCSEGCMVGCSVGTLLGWPARCDIKRVCYNENQVDGRHWSRRGVKCTKSSSNKRKS